MFLFFAFLPRANWAPRWTGLASTSVLGAGAAGAAGVAGINKGVSNEHQRRLQGPTRASARTWKDGRSATECGSALSLQPFPQGGPVVATSRHPRSQLISSLDASAPSAAVLYRYKQPSLALLEGSSWLIVGGRRAKQSQRLRMGTLTRKVILHVFPVSRRCLDQRRRSRLDMGRNNVGSINNNRNGR